MEIRPNVYQVDAIGGSNVYLLAGRRLALIDTGPVGSVPPILRFIALLGRDPKELSHIFITHGHVDHTGSLWDLRTRTGAKVVAYEGEASADLVVRGDAEFDCFGGLRVAHTPVHTAGSITIFLEERRVLFVGDIIPGRLGVPLWDCLALGGERLAAIKQRLSRFDVEVCCPGHGPVQYLRSGGDAQQQ